MKPVSERSGTRRRVLAAFTAVGCHGTFLVAVTAMFLGLQDGLRTGLGRLPGGWAWGANALLVLQFPLLHSFFLTKRGRALLGRLWSRSHGRDLLPTSYAWFAALQILLTFGLWTPSGIVLYQPTGTLATLHMGLFLGAWVFLGKALLDGGLGLQTGWIGWWAVWRGERVAFPPLATAGLFARCRQPIYLGFALTLWTGPVWTPDRLFLATVWTGYCVLGPLLKERRYLALHGETFAAYQRRVPYMLPRRVPRIVA
jgi:protein-S-isoprenylcysteine O-methyltransferase Ste14